MEIPKEICVRAKVNPRKIKRPIVKKWCYTPREEGLAPVVDVDDNDKVDEDVETLETTLAPDSEGDLTGPAERRA